jgi:heptosyltransferase III
VRNIAALGAVDLSDWANWDLGLTEADRALPRRLIAERIRGQPFIALSIGTKQPTNDWGLANWRTLAEQLCQIYPHRLVFVGAEGDREQSEAITRGLPDRCVNLCGLLKVRESAALIAGASLFVGSDSGPMHLAAAVGTPLVAIFSRLNLPGIWFPSARQAKVLYPYQPSSAITQPMVLEAAQSLLPAGSHARKLAGES